MSEHMMKEPLPQKSSRKPQQAEQAAPSTAEGTNDELLRLQRLVGNHAVQRMLTSPAELHQRTGLTVQTKMTVGAAGDAYEQEADAVAKQVMAKRDVVQRAGEEEELQMKRLDTVQRAGEEEELQMKRLDVVQRAGEEEELQMKRLDTVQRSGEEEELQMKRLDTVQRAGEEEELQMKRADTIQRESEGDEVDDEEVQMKRADIQRAGGVPVNDDEGLEREADEMGVLAQRKPVDMSGSFDVEQDVESRISAKSGSGQTIPDVNREMFESSMGHDFSGVNVHADAESDTLNKQLGARAFTTGSDIFFRQGEYNPASSGGQELLAHELTHVVQQGGAGVKAKKEED